MTSLDVGIALAAISLFFILYPHVVYPLALWLCRRFFSKPFSTDISTAPIVDILIAAHNEEDGIAICINSIFSSSYPPERIRVFVGDDGSTDATGSVVEAIAKNDSRVTYRQYKRGGKNATLDLLIPLVDASIVVFMDADTVMEKDALRHLVSPFHDETVGATISVRNPSPSTTQFIKKTDALRYQEHNSRVNQYESDLHSTVTSYGALYAVRSELVSPLNNSKAADDFLMILRAMRVKRRVVVANKAIANEMPRNSMSIEAHRKVRTVSSGIAALWMERTLLLPRYGWVAFFLWSHRVVLWCSAFFLITFFLATWLTLASPLIFGLMFYGQFALYSLALLSMASNRMGQGIAVLSIVEYFVAMNIALLKGWVAFFKAKHLDVWTPGST